MDYKKKYNEALESAKRMFSEKELNYLFPELVESEDEKIRKSLIALVMWAKSYSASGVTRDDAETMLNWLEKQGEQKPTEWSEEIERELIVYEMGIKDGINEWLKTNKET